MTTEAAEHADFAAIRYAQVWEDADVMMRGLAIEPGDTCLSIASAGDNALAMLLGDPTKVIAVDLSAAQLACVKLRIAAYRTLDHAGLLELIGSRPSDRRMELYRRCRSELDDDARTFWDARPADIARGIGATGKFENYFRLFRQRVLPLVHRRRMIDALLKPRDSAGRQSFYDQRWNNRRWRWLFKIFFSRRIMGRFGRDPAFFRYVEGSVAERIFKRAQYALTTLAPADNPYLHWILTGTHGQALPLALRLESFDTIRQRVDRVELFQGSIEEALDQMPIKSIDRYNLSDLFEYMSEENAEAVLKRCFTHGRADGRLVYWNMLVPRNRPASLARELKPMEDLARELHQEDKAFFYSRLIVEAIR